MRLVVLATALGIALEASLSSPAAAQAQQDYYAPRARVQMQRLAASWSPRGFAPVGDLRVGVLGEHERDSLAVEVESGLQYVVLGICDEDCGDIDFHLFDPAGKEIASEVKTGSRAVTWTTPATTGTHRLEVAMGRCSTPPCYYAVQLLRGPPAPSRP
ncbi:MAG TPA: hypothetical protein VGQ06_02425 [Gemmatimonadales bacterium]|jgi:hypothetical protein|nr:hypothetical protein [Gemmatimonadales bacterium]